MDLAEAMKRLKAAGTAQNRKIWARHGARGETFGVSYAELGKLRKAIQVDHELALALWATGNHDARVLATMVADPDRFDAATIDAWAAGADCSALVHALGSAASRSALGRKRAARWRKARAEWTAALGWTELAAEIRDGRPQDEAEMSALLEDVEARIHRSPNQARYAMLLALIAIGGLGGALERAALAAAKRIGPVEVDHGETECKTPDAVAYIGKIAARRAAGASRRAARAPSKRKPAGPRAKG